MRTASGCRTFHALCARLLRREAPKIGLSRDFVIYDSSDQVAVVKQAAARAEHRRRSSVPPRLALSRISHAKNRMEGPEFAARPIQLPRRADRRGSTRRYLVALKDSQRARLRRPAAQDGRALRDSRSRRASSTRTSSRTCMVDDTQDTNRPQYLLIRAARRSTSQPRRRRRSRPVDLQVARRRPAQHPRLRAATFGDAQIVRLEQNYRSTQVILDAATARDPARTETAKTSSLWTDRKGGSQDRLLTAATTSSKKRTSSPGRSSGRAPRTSTRRWPVLLPHQRRSRARLKTR